MLTKLANWSLPLLALAVFSTGCAQPINPSFPVTSREAHEDMARMKDEPRQLVRPLVVIGGIADLGLASICVRDRMDAVTMNEGIVAVGIGECLTFESCRAKVITQLEKYYPSGDSNETVEVDVIGLSMGGLVARAAALPQEDGKKRLKIARLFTISCPFQGASEAKYIPAFSPVIRDLRPGSKFTDELNSHPPEYPVYSYVRLHDCTIGSKNAALPGHVAWWVATPFPGSPHIGALFDVRILADIARRLRDEPPLTTEPPAPLPEKDGKNL